MRLVLIGNSGSGKSTLARWLASQTHAALLDLDTVAWLPEQVAIARPAEQARALVRQHCAANEHWVVEGCYTSLANVALEHQPRLLFLNPGLEHCTANCKARPWEPHKYPSKEAQDEYLQPLLHWVSDYYTRDGDLSYAAHRVCFDSYVGPKEELTQQLPMRGWDSILERAR